MAWVKVLFFLVDVALMVFWAIVITGVVVMQWVGAVDAGLEFESVLSVVMVTLAAGAVVFFNLKSKDERLERYEILQKKYIRRKYIKKARAHLRNLEGKAQGIIDE